MADKRNALLAKTSIAVKELSIGDEDFRDMLEHHYGVRSRTAMSDAQLDDLVRHLVASGWKPKAARTGSRLPQRGKLRGDQAKIRALWLSAWHLGVTDSPDEKALDAFIARMSDVQTLRFLDPGRTRPVIEGLKAMMARDALVQWPAGTADADAGRREVIRAQMRLLTRAGLSTSGVIDMVINAGRLNEVSPGLIDIDDAFQRIRGADLDRIIAALGGSVRQARAGGKR